MRSFVRFIFTLLILGIVVNLGIVLIANTRSHDAQTKALAVERDRFAQNMTAVNNKLRRGQVAVEWQRVDANQRVIETALLVRQFMPHEDSAIPLPTIRIVIPGDRVCIDGLKLYFDDWFNPEYSELRGITLFYFGRVYADETPTSKRFTFLIPDTVPFATQVHNIDDDPRPTYFENKLWRSLWYLIQNPKPEKRGLNVKWMDPACKVVKGGGFYKITAGLEGITFTEEDPSASRTDRDQMLREAIKLKP